MQKLSARTDFKIRISETRPLSRVNARISTADQNPRMQLDALDAAGCLKVYKDTATGTKAATHRTRHSNQPAGPRGDRRGTDGQAQ